MMRYSNVVLSIAFLLGSISTGVRAQVNAADSVMEHVKGNRLSVGGYGEVAYSHNFYNDNPARYSLPDEYKNAPDHGRFDLPHVVVYLGYDFGKGWTMGTEIEFEHGGTGQAYEKENEEFGEWEAETEKGGEVELEQFWIQKSFNKYANLRFGHIVVPVGLNNAHHEPLNFFTVYRPEGENTILPSTWHQTGVSFWGRTAQWRYEAQFLSGLNSNSFTRDGWIHKGAASPLEFDVANKFGLAARVDNYSVPGLRIGLSGYYGRSIGNSFPAEESGTEANYDGNILIGAVDATYKAHNWIVRAQADYGYLGDAEQLRYLYNRINKQSPFHNRALVSKNAYAYGVEAGYDVFSQVERLRQDNRKLYVFGRYEAYDSYASNTGATAYDFTARKCLAFGLNYFPVREIAVKLDYSLRMLKSKYNDEPSLNIGVVYEGFFL